MTTRPASNPFQFCPVRRLDAARVEAFAREVWPDDDERHNILQSWWMTTDADVATAAVEIDSGRIAGLCVGVPSEWDIEGQKVSAASICSWYVSPHFMGRGLGKKLVQSFAARSPYLNTFSISAAAIENFRKLGWIGPFRSSLLLFPLPGLRTAAKHRTDGITISSFVTSGRDIAPELGAALDRIDRERPRSPQRRRRTGDDWRRHLGYVPGRSYDIQIVGDERGPIGYFALRAADQQAGRQYRAARLHYVTDLAVNRDDPATLGIILRAIVAARSVRGAGAILLCTTDDRVARAARHNGWMSDQTPLIGPRLADKAPLYMKGDGFKDGGPDGLDLQLTFFDSDVDLNI